MDLYSGQPFSLFFADGTEIAATRRRRKPDEALGFFTDDGDDIRCLDEAKGIFVFVASGEVLMLETGLGKSPK